MTLAPFESLPPSANKSGFVEVLVPVSALSCKIAHLARRDLGLEGGRHYSFSGPPAGASSTGIS
jgi:hypothetical protein